MSARAGLIAKKRDLIRAARADKGCVVTGVLA
jgi:hypothetical protein